LLPIYYYYLAGNRLRGKRRMEERDIETYLFVLEEIKGIRQRVDKKEETLNVEVEKARGKKGIVR